MPDRFLDNRGYVLIESIIAITIVTVGLLGIFSLLSRSLSLNRVVADRFVAAYLAAEGIEIVKSIVDNDILAGRPWNEGVAPGAYQADYRDTALRPDAGDALRLDPVSGAYGYAEPSETPFRRTITTGISPDGEELTVSSRVTWSSRGGGIFSIHLEEHLFHWR